jgi:hypothetical protein
MLGICIADDGWADYMKLLTFGPDTGLHWAISQRMTNYNSLRRFRPREASAKDGPENSSILASKSHSSLVSGPGKATF